ncbi:MAG: hypothetical protein HQK51_03260 [Oligoflexia bacterium]|nr:hypothetical protein [Oligoflexia bacterium]
MNIEEKNSSQLVYELKTLIEVYFKKHPDLSMHAFSKKCYIATSTIRRILTMETREDPAPSTVLGIVSAISKETSIPKLIKMYDGEIGKILEKKYSGIQVEYSVDLVDILHDREAYIIYKLAANNKGTNRQEIINLLGNIANNKIDDLLEQKVLFEDNKRLFAKKGISLPEDLSLRHLPELLRFVNKGSVFINKSLYLNLSQSISKDAYMEIGKIQSDAARKILSIVNNNDNVGEIPFFFISIIDTMEAPTASETCDDI